MSFLSDQIRIIDAHIDCIPLRLQNVSIERTSGHLVTHERTTKLQSLIKTLSVSTASSASVLKSPSTIRQSLVDAKALVRDVDAAASQKGQIDASLPENDRELCWLLAAKATTQVYGSVLTHLLDDAAALTAEDWYWETALSGRLAIAYHTLQVLPLRSLDWASSVWTDVKQQSRNTGFFASNSRQTLISSWNTFYDLVRQVVRQHEVADMRRKVLGPLAHVRTGIRQKQFQLRKARTKAASVLGLLVSGGLMSDVLQSGSTVRRDTSSSDEWQVKFAHTARLMSSVLGESSLSGDQLSSATPPPIKPDLDCLFTNLINTLERVMPDFASSMRLIIQTNGRPSVTIRYWPLAALTVLSSSTLLRLVVNRKAEILTWVQNVGATVIDFGRNWVIEPTRQVLRTIRHDQDGEISIMSKRSLQGDRESLERMVVDFAVDNPGNATGTGAPLTPGEIADIRLKVREGDLTPVLRAYEKDLASPFAGTIRGNLIRALLIQVQKTKVDVEVAMGGIDALLKSQELVFGFVGLTPGILVTFALFRWLRQASLGRRSSHTAKKQGLMIRQLRNIDRLLTASPSSNGGSSDEKLGHNLYGLLLCEVHVLSQQARLTMPDQTYRELSHDLEELVNVKLGTATQAKVVDRIRWAYAKWL